MMAEGVTPFEVILGNSSARFSGVTSTMLQVLTLQKQRVGLVVLGRHHLPDDVPCIGFWALARQCRRPLPDGRWRVFHARRNDEMIQAVLLRYVLRAKIKLVFTSTAQRKKTWITRWLMSCMDGLLSTCNAAAAYMPQQPDRIIPHGIDETKYGPAENRSELYRDLELPGRYGIGIFGRVRYQKGIDLLIDAVLPILPEYPDFSVIIVGEVTSDQQPFVEEQNRKVRAAGLQDRIVITGSLPFEQVPRYVQAMSVVTAASRNEGFGLTVLEAMSCEVAVVASEAGAWPDILRDGKEGYLIPVGDVEALRDRLRRLMSDGKLRRQMGVNGRQQVLDGFTVEREAQALLDYYRWLSTPV